METIRCVSRCSGIDIDTVSYISPKACIYVAVSLLRAPELHTRIACHSIAQPPIWGTAVWYQVCERDDEAWDIVRGNGDSKCSLSLFYFTCTWHHSWSPRCSLLREAEKLSIFLTRSSSGLRIQWTRWADKAGILNPHKDEFVFIVITKWWISDVMFRVKMRFNGPVEWDLFAMPCGP